MGIATEYLTRLARLYREADADNRVFDEARRQKIIDDLTADIRAMLQQKKTGEASLPSRPSSEVPGRKHGT